MAIRQPAIIAKSAQLDAAITTIKQWHVLQSESGSTSSLFTSVSTTSPLVSDALLTADEVLPASTSSADIALSF